MTTISRTTLGLLRTRSSVASTSLHSPIASSSSCVLPNLPRIRPPIGSITSRRFASKYVGSPPTSNYKHIPQSPSEFYAAKQRAAYSARNRSLLLYATSTIILVTSASYLAVPLYRVFCSQTGYGGTPATDSSKFGAERLVPVSDLESRRIKVTFNADSSDALPWTFEPQQKEVRVLPGETALAFYSATNHSNEDIVGIATYNVTPNNIAPYFAKVECFCFEEQRILANEEVDLPVFFFIDREFLDDPLMKDVREVTLSYTFFRARRDKYGNLVPAEGPLAVADSVPAT